MGEWVPTKKQLPRHYKTKNRGFSDEVLCYVENWREGELQSHSYGVGTYHYEYGWQGDWEEEPGDYIDEYDYIITHWMPLPEPPR